MRTNGSRSYRDYEAQESYRASSRASGYNESEEIASKYNLIIGAVLLYGFFINYLMVKYCTQYFVNMNPILLIIVYFVVAIAGTIISARSDSPIISFLGYNMVVVPLGMVLSVCLVGQSAVSILNAAIVTCLVTLVMMIASWLKPSLFLSMGRALGIALIAVIIIELVCGLIFKIYMPTFWDVLVALIFCGYIGYDWAKAQQQPHTLDNAIDACVGLYLDIVNLFIRVVSVTSGRRDD